MWWIFVYRLSSFNWIDSVSTWNYLHNYTQLVDLENLFKCGNSRPPLVHRLVSCWSVCWEQRVRKTSARWPSYKIESNDIQFHFQCEMLHKRRNKPLGRQNMQWYEKLEIVYLDREAISTISQSNQLHFNAVMLNTHFNLMFILFGSWTFMEIKLSMTVRSGH